MALDTRSAAAQGLASVLAGKSLNQALPPLLEKVEARDRGLLQQLCYGTLRQLPLLEAIADQLLEKPMRDKDRDVYSLLLVGLYQLRDTRVPDHAAVSATVSAVRSLKKPWAKGLINAVLRRYIRQATALEAGLDQAAQVAHPQWLFNKIHKQWPEHASAVLAAGNSQPPMTLRINSLKTVRADYLGKLSIAGIDARAGSISPLAIMLTHPVDVTDLPGFADGEVSVQDEAAQMAATVLNARPGERILDACAAPGGKSCHILELQPKLSELITMDINGERLTKVDENLRRLGLAATLLKGDATNPPETLAPASFDRILVDAPCSAIGVIRRHPDVKVLRRESDIPQLAAQQLSILLGLWPLLKEGGHLLYATCSILNEENSRVIEKFLQQQTNAALTIPDGSWGELCSHGRQLLPEEQGPDGLFYTLLKKTPELSQQ